MGFCPGCSQELDLTGSPYWWGTSHYCADCGRRMRCYRHPDIFTPNGCKICKRNICEDCSAFIGTDRYCPDCFPGEPQQKTTSATHAQSGQYYQRPQATSQRPTSSTSKSTLSFFCVTSPICSGVAVILILISNYWAILPSGLGILTGFIGFKQVKESFGDKRGRGLAVLGIVFGILTALIELYVVGSNLFRYF